MNAPSAVDEATSLARLAEQARTLLPILRQQARRPYIVELAGTPKAGKTTALHVISRFFKECGYQVQQMPERAADCPIAMKGHFFFNTWTTTTMIASMIENLDTEADILLLDRGVFDSIVWLEAQALDDQVDAEERRIFREFALLDRWRSLTDLTFVLTVSPEAAMKRENQELLIPRKGSIVSASYLERYNGVLGQVQDSVRDQFQFVDIDTTPHPSTRETNHAIAANLIEHLERWADPQIAAVPRPFIDRLFGNRNLLEVSDAMEALQAELVIRRRSQLEVDEDFVQLVSAAVLRHEGKMLLLRRAGARDEKRRTYGRDLLWKGCHIPCSQSDSVDLLSTASAAIKARLKEDFHLARFQSEPIGHYLIWNRDPQETRHLGIFFDLEIPSAQVAQSLATKVFKRERNRTKLKSNQFISASQIYARMKTPGDIQLESWSQQLLRHILDR